MQPAPHPLEADLSAYLDGELPPERRRQVEAWLAESDEARQRLAELRAVSERLAALPRLAAPVTLTAALTRAAEQRQLFGDDGAARRLRIYRATVRVLSAAAVLLVAVGVGYYARRAGTVEPPRPIRVSPPREDAAQALREPQADMTAAAPAGTAGAGDMLPPAAVAYRAASPVAVFDADEAGGVGATDSVRNPDSGRPPNWPDLAREARAAGAGRAVIDVTITPTNPVEYAATVAVLNEWENRGLVAAAEGGEPVSRQAAFHGGAAATAVEQVYEVEAGDLSYRLNQLALSAPQQVFVQMSFIAAPDDILSRVASAQPDASSYALFSITAGLGSDDMQERAVRELLRSQGQRAPAPHPPSETIPPSAWGGRRADTDTKPARGGGPPVGGPPAAGPPRAPTADHPTGGAAGRAGEAGAPGPAGPPAAAASAREQTPPPAAEPAPAASAPSGPPNAPEAARDTDRAPGASATLWTAGRAGGITSSSVADLETRSTQRLLALLLRGQQPVTADAVRSENRAGPRDDSEGGSGRPVLFRVRLLPPLGSGSAAEAVGPPAELANTATRPAAEAAPLGSGPAPAPPAESR